MRCFKLNYSLYFFTIPYHFFMKISLKMLVFPFLCLTLISSSFGSVVSTSGNITFDVNDDVITGGHFEAKLDSTGLAIGGNLSAEANLHVQGNAIVTQSLTVGSAVSSSSNFHLSGTKSQSFEVVSGNATLGTESLVLSGNTSGNIVLWIPNASSVGNGRVYHIKKTVSENEINIVATGGGNIDDKFGVMLSSGDLGNVELISASGNWYVLDISGNGVFVWTPEYMTTVGWYDASDASTITDAGGQVSQWDDKSGNARHLNVVGGNTPEWGLGAQINGMNVMHYSNTFDELDNDSLPNIDCTQVAILSVGMAKTAGDSPNYGSIYSTDVSDKLAVRGNSNGANGSLASSIKLDGASTSLSTGSDAQLAEETPTMMIAWYDGTDAYCRANGGAVSVTQNVADGATFTINAIQCGRDSNTPRNYHGEMIILNIADLSTLQKIEGYLAWKWGLEGNLPISHPFKSVAP